MNTARVRRAPADSKNMRGLAAGEAAASPWKCGFRQLGGPRTEKQTPGEPSSASAESAKIMVQLRYSVAGKAHKDLAAAGTDVNVLSFMPGQRQLILNHFN